MTVADFASAIKTDLISGSSVLEAGAVNLTVTSIDVEDVAMQLTDAQAEPVLAALALLTYYGVVVSGISVADIGNIGGIGSGLTGMTVSDSATAIHDDLVNGTSSELYIYRGKITA